MADMKTISWGILGCGGIANKFAVSIAVTDGSVLTAVASRTKGKAAEFAKKHRVAAFHESYDDLVARDDVDAVYVATTHNFHYENIKTALMHGKHVLCEKPLTVNAREAKELIELARQKKLFMMEGMWTRFLPAIVKLREWLKDGLIGEIRQVRADFGFRIGFDPKHRLLNPELAGGALLDAGIYPLSFASMVMGTAPKEIKAVGEIGSTGVDEQSVYLLTYGDGRISVLSSAVRTALTNRAEIIGTDGRIVVPPLFLMAQRVELHKNGEDAVVFEHPFVDQEGFQFEIAEAARAIRAGETECPAMPLDETLQLMQTIDEIKSQLGLVYGNDR